MPKFIYNDTKQTIERKKIIIIIIIIIYFRIGQI